ncbi:hypothetical protein MtrunA17_Chr4g0051811 [Medicago truncatula]|uniref:Transmembrane protein n=1 Tax=Medicago truncatula TaxID=3880 RepID=A0A396IDG2_MEDTR|nr:hypothetical protein MtrunA17_Chr4g0051811 [Medicago truncatula]
MYLHHTPNMHLSYIILTAMQINVQTILHIELILLSCNREIFVGLRYIFYIKILRIVASFLVKQSSTLPFPNYLSEERNSSHSIFSSACFCSVLIVFKLCFFMHICVVYLAFFNIVVHVQFANIVFLV